MSVAISYRKSCTKSISYRKNGFLVVLRVHHRAFHYKIIILSAKHHYKNIIMSAKHPYKIIIMSAKDQYCYYEIVISNVKTLVEPETPIHPRDLQLRNNRRFSIEK